ncbi:MAG: DMT family transporter [Acidimicrobiia bacterium]
MTRVIALTGILAISFTAVLVRLADVSPLTAGFFRAAYAVPILLVMWLLTRNSDRRTRADRRLGFVSGLILAVDLWLFHAAIGAIGAGLGTLLANIQVVFVALAAWAIHDERPSTTAFVAIPVVFTGVALLSGLGRADAYGSDPVAGVILGALSGIAYASFILTYRAANRSQSSAIGTLLDATIGVVIGTGLAGMVTGTLDLRFAWPAHGWLLLLAVLAQVFGWVIIGYALPRLPALTTSVLIMVQPIGALTWGALIFHERLSAIQGIGVAIILVGVAAINVLGSIRPAAVQAGSPGSLRTAR